MIGDFFADSSSALGGTLGFVVAPLLAAGAWWTRRRRPLGRRPAGPAARRHRHPDRPGRLAGAQIEPSWTVRYLAVIVAPLLLAAAGALAPSSPGPGGRGRDLRAAGRLERDRLAAAEPERPLRQEQRGRRGPGRGPAAGSRRRGGRPPRPSSWPCWPTTCPRGCVYITPTGPVSDPYVVDWRNIVSRLQQAQPCDAVAPSHRRPSGRRPRARGQPGPPAGSQRFGLVPGRQRPGGRRSTG